MGESKSSFAALLSISALRIEIRSVSARPDEEDITRDSTIDLFELDGKAAIVTGGNGGIGYSIQGWTVLPSL